MPEWSREDLDKLHWGYISADQISERIRQGYDPVIPLGTSVSGGNIENVRVLVDAIKTKYANKPEELAESLGNGRFIRSGAGKAIVTGIWKFAQKFGEMMGEKGDPLDNIDACNKIVDEELQTAIDSIPLPKRRTYQAKYPPLDERTNFR